MFFFNDMILLQLTFVWGDLVHGDTAAIGESEHDFGDAVVSQAPPGITVPLKLRLGDHSSNRTQQ